MHRVLAPPSTADGAVRRRSIAWFRQPNWDADIACLPSCCDEDNLPRSGKVTSGEHLLAKLMGPRLLQPSAGLAWHHLPMSEQRGRRHEVRCAA